jgi:prolyl 4-hydroxylase
MSTSEEKREEKAPEQSPEAAGALAQQNPSSQNVFQSFAGLTGTPAEWQALILAASANNNSSRALQQQQQQLVALQSFQSLQQAQQLAAAQQALLAANPAMTHNLIPIHLQASALAPTMHGTPGHPSAVIPTTGLQAAAAAAVAAASPPSPPPLTVQDRLLTPAVYNGVNPAYPGLRVLNSQPPVFGVDNFLTPLECQFLVAAAQDSFGPAPVVGKGAGEVSPSRTSSTCYLAREDLPDLLRKVCLLTGKPVEHCELPQVGRYFPSQQYLQHYDAFDLGTEDGRRFAANGGQRVVTVLIYLNTVHRGGATRFPALNLDVHPVQGAALVFFPATVDGLLDKMALHAALPAVDTKYVSQVWIRQSNYAGQPSKRLPQTLGVPFGHEQTAAPQQLTQPQQRQLLQMQQQAAQQQTILPTMSHF